MVHFPGLQKFGSAEKVFQSPFEFLHIWVDLKGMLKNPFGPPKAGPMDDK